MRLQSAGHAIARRQRGWDHHPQRVAVPVEQHGVAKTNLGGFARKQVTEIHRVQPIPVLLQQQRTVAAGDCIFVFLLCGLALNHAAAQRFPRELDLQIEQHGIHR